MSRRPNILLITSDQQHVSTLGVTNPRIRTPALDRLCREGTRFDRAYCPNPTCTPTRASIITGMYPSQHGAWTLGTKLPEDVPTVGQLLGQAGYRSTLIGKAHFQPLRSEPGLESIESQPLMRDLDYWRDFHGPWYGFDHIEIARMHADESHAGQHYAIWMEQKGLTNWRDYFWPWPHHKAMRKRKHHWDLPAELHYSTWTAERTVAHLQQAADNDGQQPFFLWASFHDPHPPYLAPSPWDTMYDPDQMEPGTLEPGELEHWPPPLRKTQQADPDFSNWQETGHNLHGCHSHLHDRKAMQQNMATYYGMTSFMDQQIGRILDQLDVLGLADNTLVVFTSDHGHFLGHHGLMAKGPFHFEDLLRVPLIVRFPGRVPADRTSSAIQSLVDLAPTFLETAGLSVPGSMTGLSQCDAWQGGAAVRDHAVVENRHEPTALHLHTYITERYKLTCYRNETFGELFDLQQDPGERRNRWDDPQYAGIKSDLLLRAAQMEMQRQPTRIPRYANA